MARDLRQTLIMTKQVRNHLVNFHWFWLCSCSIVVEFICKFLVCLQSMFKTRQPAINITRQYRPSPSRTPSPPHPCQAISSLTRWKRWKGIESPDQCPLSSPFCWAKYLVSVPSSLPGRTRTRHIPPSPCGQMDRHL